MNVALLFEIIFVGLWSAWAIVWFVMGRRVKAVAERESAGSRLAHVVPLIVAAYLLAAPHTPIPWLDARFAPESLSGATLGAALTFAGLAFAVWARFRIGGNWSGIVTVKHDHELVTGGPYRWVRHPIYTGLLAAMLGTAIAVGEWRGLLAVAIAAAALWRKLRVEEKLMRRQFGNAYARYAERVPALIPFALRRRPVQGESA